MAGMVVAAGVDAAGDLELEFAEIGLTQGEAGGDLLRDRDRAGVGEAAVIQAGAGDDVGDQVEVGFGEAGVGERLPNFAKVAHSDVGEDDILAVRYA